MSDSLALLKGICIKLIAILDKTPPFEFRSGLERRTKDVKVLNYRRKAARRTHPQTVPAAPIVTQVTNTPLAFSFASGTVQMTGLAFDANGIGIAGRVQAWTSSNTAVATVNPTTGLVTFVGVGDTSISVLIDGVRSSVPALGHGTVEPVNSVALNRYSNSLTVGQTDVLTATPQAADTTQLLGRTNTWVTSNAAIATVGADTVGTNEHECTVTAIAAGSCTIRALCEGVYSNVYALAVNAVPVILVPTTIQVSASTASGSPGSGIVVGVIVKDQNGTAMAGQTIAATSNFPAIASVLVSGSNVTISYLTNGAATITVTCASATPATVSVTIAAPVATSLSLNITTVTGDTSGTTTLVATARDAGGNIITTGTMPTWTSNNANITFPAGTSWSKVFTHALAGSAIATATLGTLTATCTFTLTTFVAGILPAICDPQRLGNNLLAGNSWSSVVGNLAADEGRAYLRSIAGLTFGNSSGGTVDDAPVAQLSASADALGVMPMCVNNTLIGGQKTISMGVFTTATTHFWFTVYARFYSLNNYGTSAFTGNTTWWSPLADLAVTPGESQELKWMFAFSTNGAVTRQQFDVTNQSNRMSCDGGNSWIIDKTVSPWIHSENDYTVTEMIQTLNLATHPQSYKHPTQGGFYPSILPGSVTSPRVGSTVIVNADATHPKSTTVYRNAPKDLMSQPIPANYLGTSLISGHPGHGDWYRYTLNYEVLTGSVNVEGGSYLYRFFIERMSANGIWAGPGTWGVPIWKGAIVTNGRPLSYNQFKHTGNRSGANVTASTVLASGAYVAPAKTIMGPWEVTNATDPYGYDGYGK